MASSTTTRGGWGGVVVAGGDCARVRAALRERHRRDRGLRQRTRRGPIGARATTLSGYELGLVLAGSASAGEFIAEKTRFGKALSGPVATMLVGALFINVAAPAGIVLDLKDLRVAQTALVSISTPLLLMGANLRAIVKGAGPLILPFAFGSIGTCIGACIAASLFASSLSASLDTGAGDVSGIIAALAAKNVGGGFNFVAVTESVGVSSVAVALALAADNIAALLYFPLNSIFAGQGDDDNDADDAVVSEAGAGEWMGRDGGGFGAREISLCLAFSLGILSALEVSGFGAKGRMLPTATAVTIIVATCFNKTIDSHPSMRAAGEALSRVFLGLFFASAGLAGGLVIGIDASALFPLLGALACVYASHILFVACAQFVFKISPYEAAVVSNANVGGPATAAALAASMGKDTTVPICLGILGNSVATFAALGLLPLLNSLV